MVIERDIYGIFPAPVFRRDFGVFVKNKLVPRIAYGTIFVSSIGQIFGMQGPFFLCSLINLIGLLFLYLFVKIIYNKKIAYFSAIDYMVIF